MRRWAETTLLLLVAMLWGCSRTVLGGVNVSAEHGVSGGITTSNPRDEMVPALVYQLTHDFRPTAVRQPAN